MNECTRCGIEIEAGVFNQIRHDEECKGTKDFPVRHLSEMGIPMTSPSRSVTFKADTGVITDYCKELGCTKKGHHPECALNTQTDFQRSKDKFMGLVEESAQQRLENIWRDHKWSIAIGIQIIVAAILKYRGIL